MCVLGRGPFLPELRKVPLLVLKSPNTLWEDLLRASWSLPICTHSGIPFGLTLNITLQSQFPNSHPFLGLVPKCHTLISTQLPPQTPQASLPLHGSCLPVYPAFTYPIMVAGSSLSAGAQGYQQCRSLHIHQSLANSPSTSLSATQVQPHHLPPGSAQSLGPGALGSRHIPRSVSHGHERAL